jgi:hypothetical protein
MYCASRLVRVFALFATALLLVGCPPQIYVLVRNDLNIPVKGDFTCDGSGTLLPHYTLAAHQSRRTRSGCMITAHDVEGHLLGSIDTGPLRHEQQKFHRYFDSPTYTFGVAITRKGLDFFHP